MSYPICTYLLRPVFSNILQSDILLLLFSQTVFRGHQKPLGHTLGGVVIGLIPMVLCSTFRHCHLLLPRFSPFLHLPYPPPMPVYFLISPITVIVFSVLFKDLFLAFFLLFYSIVPFIPGDFSLVISEDLLSLSVPALS